MTLNAPIKTYLKVYVGLLLLLAATVGAASMNLGIFNTVVALAIAFAKALLVILFFMHIRAGTRAAWIYAAAGFFWISLLIGGTLVDVLTRR